MSHYFPTAAEAMQTLEAEAGLIALEGRTREGRPNRLQIAKAAIQRELSQLERISTTPTWCLRANERLAPSQRFEWVHAEWYVPVRPRPGTPEYKDRAILCTHPGKKRKGRRLVDETTAMAILWTEMGADDSKSKLVGNVMMAPSVVLAALGLARLRLARERAEFWQSIDFCYAGVASLLLGGAR